MNGGGGGGGGGAQAAQLIWMVVKAVRMQYFQIKSKPKMYSIFTWVVVQ